MKILEVNLAPREQEQITVALVQFSSPLLTDVEKVLKPHGEELAVAHNRKEAYRAKIDVLLQTLSRVHEQMTEPVEVIALPEYSFLSDDRGVHTKDRTTLDLCEHFVQTSGKILIGNFYDVAQRKSVTFMSLPAKALATPPATDGPVTYKASKFTRTQYDDDILKPTPRTPGTDHHSIRASWQIVGSSKTAYLQTLTCKDYLYATSAGPLRAYPNVIRLDTPGLIVGVLCSPDIQSFEHRAESLLRDIPLEDGFKSIISCFVNGALGDTQPAPYHPVPCGGSQIMCPIDTKSDIKPILASENQGVLIARLNPFNTLVKPTSVATPQPNAVLLSAKTAEITTSSSGNVSLNTTSADTRRHTGFVPNPAALHNLGFRKVYGFIRGDDYKAFKASVQQRFKLFPPLAVAIYGVYGIHDVLIASWEECYEYDAVRQRLSTRLWPMLPYKSQVQSERAGVCIVERFLKYHQIDLTTQDTTQVAQMSATDKDIQGLFYKLATGVIETSELQDLRSYGLLLDTPYDTSDISDAERVEGKLEVLILVRIVQADHELKGKGTRDDFTLEMLPLLLADPRVRTIEQVKTDDTGYLEADYILHVVGDLEDLNDIIINTLHNTTSLGTHPSSFRCKTMVVIPAEKLSPSNHPALLEEHRIPSVQPTLELIMDQWKDAARSDPVLSNKLIPCSLHFIEERVLRSLLQVYFLSDALARVHPDQQQSIRDRFMQALYVLSAAIGGSKLNYHSTPAEVMMGCQPFFMLVAKEVEHTLQQLLLALCKESNLSPEAFGAVATACVGVAKGRLEQLRFDVNKVEIGTAAFVLEKLHAITQKDRLKAEVLADPALVASGLDLKPLLTKIETLDVNLPAIIRDLQQFSKPRNAFAHSHDAALSPECILESLFAGLRFRDRAQAYIDKNHTPHSHPAANAAAP